MTKNNARHEAPVRTFLEAMVQDPAQHARFLNMLSMLEHMGSRKIMVSQMHDPANMTEDMLKHLAEEARHAYFFKRQAERVARAPMPGYHDDNTFCRIPAAMYFGRLDAGLARQVPTAEAYPWVSLIIELRACWIYGIYHRVLQDAKITISLKSLLAEEDMHLAEMFEMCNDNIPRLQALSAYETELFGKLLGALQVELSTAAQLASKAA
jgi:hypothetical protein